MDSIKSFNILKVTMNGFKRFIEPFEVNLGDLSYISGENEQGKTTIADAIAFAFCGVPFWGEKSAERLLNQDSKGMQVIIEFIDDNGKIHKLLRRRTGSNTTITLDTLPVRQVDISSIFAERDIFLSIFNPLYFIEKIAEDGRDFLQKLLPPVDEEMVLSGLSEAVAKLLEKESMLDPEYYIKQKRERIRELNDDNTYFSGQIDLLKKQQLDNQKRLEDNASRIQEVKSKISGLEQMQFKDIDTAVLQKQREEILNLIASDNRKELLAKQSTIRAAEYQSKLTDELAKLNAEINELLLQHKKLSRLITAIKPGIKCSTCFREITGQNQEAVKKELQSQLNSIIATGKKLTADKTELMELDKKCADQFYKFREEDLKKVEVELEEFSGADLAQLSLIDDTLRFGNLSEDQLNELNCLKADLIQLEAEMEAISDIEKSIGEIARIEAVIKSNNDDVIRQQNLIHAAVEYAAKRAELSLMHLQMDKASIKLIDIIKSTGEIKNVFRFTYNGKDYRWLSTSEQVKAGIEVANLLRGLTGCNYPTFIDNAECITTALKKPCGQTIFAFAKKGELTVVSKKQPYSKEAA